MSPMRKTRIWILTIVGLIYGLALLGGITRMKLAGLSIVEWKPIVGVLPPLSADDWQAEFSKYQLIPQYHLVFSTISLEQFKSIFFLEYFHRLLARLIGLLVLGGLLFKRTRKIGLQGGALMLIQGAVGWWMVKSGLTERASVAPLRLAIHLGLATITIAYFFREALLLDLRKPKKATVFGLSFGLAFSAQFLLGALSSGTHAAEIFPTFPEMNGDWIPAGLLPVTFERLVSDHPLVSHWFHRLIGTLLLAFSLFQAIRKPGAWSLLAGLILFQFILGISTVVTGGMFSLKLLHQAGAFLILLTLIRLRYSSQETSSL